MKTHTKHLSQLHSIPCECTTTEEFSSFLTTLPIELISFQGASAVRLDAQDTTYAKLIPLQASMYGIIRLNRLDHCYLIRFLLVDGYLTIEEIHEISRREKGE